MTDINKSLYGTDLFGESMAPTPANITTGRFGQPPFSILDSRKGDWQDRKRAWASLGIMGEVGRSAKAHNTHEWASDKANKQLPGDGTSIFDPVLCELMYSWFCPAGGIIVDPFAGGSVRGIVATSLGYNYWGCDLSSVQIDANRVQSDEIPTDPSPVWVCGDSMEQVPTAPDADFIFSCPPYGDLEKYSDDPRDISSMEYHTFLPTYKTIILRSLLRLKNNRFACFVVGDFRDKNGFYRDFVSATIRGFEESGARLYNEGILATAVGTACLRANCTFGPGRKLVKVHQNVLVFCKGDWRKAANYIKTRQGGML